MRKGFTLIETLIVITILAVVVGFMLGSSGDVRKSGRDDRRIADLKQVQQSLQLFYLKCGFYPGSFNPATSDCDGTDAPSTWDNLRQKLQDAVIGVSDIPNDPQPGKTYWYYAGKFDASPKLLQCYVLKAQLETKHPNLDREDLDDSAISDKNLYQSSPDCDDTGNNYCIGNLECFYGE